LRSKGFFFDREILSLLLSCSGYNKESPKGKVSIAGCIFSDKAMPDACERAAYMRRTTRHVIL
jgi:hypothetical protein